MFIWQGVSWSHHPLVLLTESPLSEGVEGARSNINIETINIHILHKKPIFHIENLVPKQPVLGKAAAATTSSLLTTRKSSWSDCGSQEQINASFGTCPQPCTCAWHRAAERVIHIYVLSGFKKPIISPNPVKRHTEINFFLRLEVQQIEMFPFLFFFFFYLVTGGEI